jgi:hypothetical protein
MDTTMPEIKIKKRRKSRQSSELINELTEFPAISVRGLWKMATEEEQQNAKRLGIKIIQEWTNQISKSQAAKDLKMTPVRYWQLSNQAIAGMLAGLLDQPRSRGKILQKEQKEIEKLRIQIKQLEMALNAQSHLIEFMKGVPKAMNKKIKDDLNAKRASTKNNKRQNRQKSENFSKGQSVDGSAHTASDNTNTEELEKECR